MIELRRVKKKGVTCHKKEEEEERGKRVLMTSLYGG